MLCLTCVFLLICLCLLWPQVIGPRHAFAVSKGLEAKLTSSGGSCNTSNVRKHGGAWGWNLTLLVSGEDVDFVEGLGKG
jgi:hypothetical protein